MPTWKYVNKMPPLDEAEEAVMLRSATEAPYSGIYVDLNESGLYLCRQCGLPLYRSDDKFACGCGWPAFDDALPEAVVRRSDPDGERTEIVCANCCGHLGHVFQGEKLTPKNLRHCVNSRALSFYATMRAIFAGGCFWGVEDAFAAEDGVLCAVSGYTGGETAHPAYRDVCSGGTGHAEAVLLDYDPEKISYRSLLHVFFEIHDPTQLDRQGPDVGSQYRSAVFYLNETQRQIASETIVWLRAHGISAVTELVPAGAFYPAEDYHQKYFVKHPEKRAHLCHRRSAIMWP